MENIYAISDHLTLAQTQETLALAALLGVVGFLLAEHNMLVGFYRRMRGLGSVPVPRAPRRAESQSHA